MNMEFASVPEDYVAGFAVLVGRPNAGKSTLTNALVGQKVAITSNRPQTTRHTIRGIVHREHSQLILIDTPGLHRPRTLLGERLNDLVAETLSEVDVIGFCIPADEKIGPGDRYIAAQLAAAGNKPIVAIVTKADKVPSDRLAKQLVAVTALGNEVMTAERRARAERAQRRSRRRGGTTVDDRAEQTMDAVSSPQPADDGQGGWADIIPVSAVKDYQVDGVSEVLSHHLPDSPPLYPDGDLTDEPEAVMVGELVREAALEGVRDELPHSVAVTVEEMNDREGRPEDDPMVDVHVNLFVERDSQKAIIIGKGGSRLREIGTKARQGIEPLLGAKVYLSIHVKVAKDWQRDPRALGRLGF
ncbi:GTP-binding protein [Kocuria koreensis]|uniref:GTPase Era n=2 Tax=Rothia koreensis TaxID=592378 RepID=A0A7K1LGN3_9MICC|nr:GTPase Era [Rothia koreensis]MUN54357.1 GTP-binding protein [Rothia koreensis]